MAGRFRSAALLCSVLSAAAGCQSPSRYFSVSSHPAGARIYLDGVQEGFTDEEKLQVDFAGREAVWLKIEKDGYQPEGMTLGPETRGPIRIFLKEAPQSEKVIQELKDIRELLEELQHR